jgi:hypothetical protein
MHSQEFGERLVRIAYLDESRRSRHERIVVVGGVVVHGDRDYRRIEGALIHLASDTISDPDQDGFVFHANHLFHAGGYFRDKEVWPREWRYPILERLAGIVSAFRLPVVFGHLEKVPAPVLAERSDRARRAVHGHPGQNSRPLSLSLRTSASAISL